MTTAPHIVPLPHPKLWSDFGKVTLGKAPSHGTGGTGWDLCQLTSDSQGPWEAGCFLDWALLLP